MASFKKIYKLLSSHERKRAGLLLGMIFIMSLLDAIGIASVMPFLSVLANPDVVTQNEFLALLYNHLEFENEQSYLFFLGLMVFFFLIMSLAFKTLTTYALLRFVLLREFSLGHRLVESYLHRPFSWLLNRHSAELGKNVLSEVSQVIQHALLPAMTVITQGILCLIILLLLFIVSPVLALTSGIVFSASYFLISRVTKKILLKIGNERLIANDKRYKTLNEIFGAFKEVKLKSLELVFLDRYSLPAKQYASHTATAQVIGQLPRFALEGIAFGGMLLVILYLMDKKNDLAVALPVMGVYAFAGYRLMPALQQVYNGISQLRFSGPALDALYNDFQEIVSAEKIKLPGSKKHPKDVIELKNVSYRYPGSEKNALSDVSLTIKVGKNVGIVGSTGSGKTTAVDLLLGLLEPQNGALIIDGQVIGAKTRRQWQNNIGYVPQHIFLTDASIASNIAFGTRAEEIDFDRVKSAAKIANLHSFVEDQPQGYGTTVGEAGVRLSGGQRQRVGIARALYQQPAVLVLDEATSALDNLTERVVMDAITNMDRDTTIINITHRVRTLEGCDLIYVLEKGKVIQQGSYSEVSISNPLFHETLGVN